MTDKELRDAIAENEKKISDLQKRSAECKPEELDGISKNLSELLEKNGELIAQRRSALMEATKAASNGDANPITAAPDKKNELAKSFISSRNMVLDTAEMRSILLSSGDLATPTAVSGISAGLSAVPSLLNDVKVVNAAGRAEERVGYDKTDGTAVKGVEGTAPVGSDGGTFGIVVIKPYSVVATEKVSKLIPSETPLGYEARVMDKLAAAIRKKVCVLIANGDGTDFYGIQNAVDKDAVSMVQTKTLTAVIGAGTLREEIILPYAGDDQLNGNAVMYLDKATLAKFGSVRGTNEKKAVYDITFTNGSTGGIIQDGGLATRFEIVNGLAGKILYGAPLCYQLDLFAPLSVTVSSERYFEEGLDCIRGETSIGGNVIVKNGFMVITQYAGA